MSSIWGHVIGVITIILMLTFISIWIWAWRKKHKRTFSRMARLPMEDDPAGAADIDSNEDPP